jgi:hypothetical protein
MGVKIPSREDAGGGGRSPASDPAKAVGSESAEKWSRTEADAQSMPHVTPNIEATPESVFDAASTSVNPKPLRQIPSDI